MSQVNPLFFTPLYVDKSEITSDEQKVIAGLDYVENKLGDHHITSDKQLFKNSACRSLHDKIQNHINHFIYDYVQVKDVIKPKFLSSWAFRGQQGHWGGEHSHVGAMLSGVLYIDAHPDQGAIVFHKDNTHPSLFHYSMTVPVNQATPYACTRFRHYPNTGDCVIFPGWLRHSVDPNKTSKPRYSLAFDVFLQGDYSISPQQDKMITVDESNSIW